jgi:Sigma-70, region 4
VTGNGGNGPGEPVAAAAAVPDPAREAELSDSLSLAFLVVLERLTPEQRAVFLLRDVFDYPYVEIAEIVGRTEVATRQLATRARARVQDEKPRYRASRREGPELATRFFAAARDGDVEALEAMLAADVELHGDGGGKAPALARPIYGRARAARTLAAWSKGAARFGGVSFRMVEINAQPGGITLDPSGRVLNAIVLDIAEGQIQAVRSVVNPDKLRHLGPVADLSALLRGEG